jgi:type IV pilus assembly protein PilY1
MFHSNPVVVGEPSRFFENEGFSGPGGFYEKNKNRTKVIIAGANDGMLHAFNTETGNEEWALIPNSLLKTLNSMKTNHTYYVDATPKVADVWFDLNRDNKKTADEWKTVLICGLRKGGNQYFALDITNTLDPHYLWEFPKSTDLANLAKVGQSWSEPAIGKVKIEQGTELVEKWVAFIGGGYDPYDEKKDTEAINGKVFFVIDIMTGEMIKEFSGLVLMRHSFPAPPTTLDTNSDGYVDKVYIGDLGGQMWVFDVSFDEASKKSDSQWKGQRLFKAPLEPFEKHNIFYQAAVAFDRQKNPWVYFGTGNRESPTDTTNPQERFYAVMDDGKEDYPRLENNLKDVTDLNTFSLDQTKKGWYIRLEKASKRLEKVLGKPTVFNKLLYFTTYFYNDKGDPCSVAGDPKLYVVEYLSGGGALVLDDYLKGKPSERSRIIGEGVPSSPVITANMKGKDLVVIGTTTGQVYSAKVLSPTTAKEILYWREVIP